MLLQDLGNIIYWSTVLDVFLFIFALSSFMTSTAEAYPVFFHTVHVLRAVAGGMFVFKQPTNSAILDLVQESVKKENKFN